MLSLRAAKTPRCLGLASGGPWGWVELTLAADGGLGPSVHGELLSLWGPGAAHSTADVREHPARHVCWRGRREVTARCRPDSTWGGQDQQPPPTMSLPVRLNQPGERCPGPVSLPALLLPLQATWCGGPVTGQGLSKASVECHYGNSPSSARLCTPRALRGRPLTRGVSVQGGEALAPSGAVPALERARRPQDSAPTAGRPRDVPDAVTVRPAPRHRAAPRSAVTDCVDHAGTTAAPAGGTVGRMQ